MELLPQDIFIQKIRVLLPGCVVTVRPYDNNEHIVSNPVIRGEFLLDWPDSNGICPDIATINSVTIDAVEQMVDVERKRERDSQYRKNLSMRASYIRQRSTNPSLTFSEYLDQLEQEQV